MKLFLTFGFGASGGTSQVPVRWRQLMNLKTMRILIFGLVLINFSCCQKIYLSDTNPYYQRLEAIQKAEIENLYGTSEVPPTTNFQSKKEVLKLLDETQERLCKVYGEDWCNNKETMKILKKALKNKIPTRYENPLAYWYKTLLLDDIQKASQRLNYVQQKDKLIYGTVLSKKNVAEAQFFKDKHILISHLRFYLFCYHMLKICHLPLSVEDATNGKVAITADTTSIKYAIRTNSKIGEEFTYSILTFLYNLNPYEVDVPGFEKSLITITEAMEIFVLGHEFAHAFKKHTIILKDESAYDDEYKKKLKTLQSWRNEYEADILGYNIAQETISNGVFGKKNGLEVLQRFGPLLYMECLNTLEKGDKIIKDSTVLPTISDVERSAFLRLLRDTLTPEETIKNLASINSYWLSKDHPPTEIRALYINELLQNTINNLKTKFSEDEMSLNEIAKSLVYSINKIYNYSEFAFFRWYSFKHILNQEK